MCIFDLLCRYVLGVGDDNANACMVLIYFLGRSRKEAVWLACLGQPKSHNSAVFVENKLFDKKCDSRKATILDVCFAGKDKFG